VTEIFLDGLGIRTLAELSPSAGLVPDEPLTTGPSKIPRWASAPSWCSSQRSIELQSIGLGEREFGFTSSIATTASVDTTTSPRKQVGISSMYKRKGLSSVFKSDSDSHSSAAQGATSCSRHQSCRLHRGHVPTCSQEKCDQMVETDDLQIEEDDVVASK
jgi:hypothetical protein